MLIKVLNIITGGLRREGITSTQLELIKKMDRTDIQMDIAAVFDNEPDVIDEFRSLGCRVIEFPDRHHQLPSYIATLYSTMRKEKYDVVHVHGSSALMTIELTTAWLAGVKVRIAHSRNTKCENEKVDRLMRPAFALSYTNAFACGQDAGQWLFKNKPFTVIHNGKDLNRFQFDRKIRDYIRGEYDLEGKFVIGFVGNLVEQKNLHFLIDVFKAIHLKYPNSILFLMGDGDQRDSLERKAKQLDISDSVIFTGRISNVPEMLQAMDVMMLPSLFEGLPNVVLEWQISGLPCLISNNITKECKVTDLVKFLPIDKGVGAWIDCIKDIDISMDRAAISESSCVAMKKEAFEIDENVQLVKNLYIDAVRGT